MIPIGDVIPTRTPPVVTIGMIALTVVLSTQVIASGIGVVVLNMVFLWLFGWTVEDRLGHGRFAALYLITGAAAFAASTSLVAVSSGVASIVGAYFVLYPKSSMLVLIPVPLSVVEIPAAVFLALWCLLQLLTGMFAVPFASFFAGAALCVLMKRPERVRVEWWSP